ncbi:MAG: acyl-CoA/acyl-ACP dehydrogenase [Fibrobacteria bacterium]|nr:acyl-CoA/acyl-ACP dehydrogenase [Fibrobacteria bacterium]
MNESEKKSFLQTLPGDYFCQIMWRFADRFDLQMLVQSTRPVARGIVAQMVAEGVRNSHEWNDKKQNMLTAFDESGISSVFIDSEFGGFIAGPKNMAMALVSFELAWVDGGSATCSLATNLALDPIHEKGTYEQNKHYMSGCIPAAPGEDRETFRGAFALTEPLPYVGVDAACISGKMRIAEWEEGKEPMLQIEKRGRFITNMDFANFITAAVDTGDERIKTSTMVILEKSDEGVFDKGVPTKKLVHQLSSTCDPVFSLKIPASRIIGGYTIKDGVIIPNCSHAEIIEAVFRRTRVTVGLMSSAKLLSAIEPVIRYHRTRYRGGDASKPETARFDLGIQQKEDASQRLVDVWATGEASASLGFAAARLFDEYDPIEREADKILEEQGVKGPRAKIKAFRKIKEDVKELIRLSYQPEDKRDNARYEELAADPVIHFQAKDPLAMVLCPACKLWNTGWGATMMREAVSLVGGYGITEDCPGFLMQKWSDMQLEATYEGPEVVQRRQLSISMVNELFIEHVNCWIEEMNALSSTHPDLGLDSLIAGFKIWLYTVNYAQTSVDEDGKKLYHGSRQAVTFSLADAISWLLASRHQILDVIELKEKGPENPVLQEGLPGLIQFFSDMCVHQAARTAGEVGRITSELIYGYKNTTPDNLDEYRALRQSIDENIAGARLARQRAGESINKVMIPEALDYPQQ